VHSRQTILLCSEHQQVVVEIATIVHQHLEDSAALVGQLRAEASTGLANAQRAGAHRQRHAYLPNPPARARAPAIVCPGFAALSLDRRPADRGDGHMYERPSIQWLLRVGSHYHQPRCRLGAQKKTVEDARDELPPVRTTALTSSTSAGMPPCGQSEACTAIR